MNADDFIDRMAHAIATNQPTSIAEETAWREYPDFREKVAKRLEELGQPFLAELLLHRDTSAPLYQVTDFVAHCLTIVPAFSAVNEELLAFLARHPEYLQDLHWRHFEEVLEAIFRNQGFDVWLGPGGGDHGVDLRLINKDSIGSFLTIVQAKRYRRDRRITLEAVAALEGLLDSNRAHRGLFVTTSDFLPGARAFAEAQSYRLHLAAADDVARWLRQLHGLGT